VARERAEGRDGGWDWAAPVCECCYEGLHPGIPVVVSYWSVSEASYLCKTPEEHLPFTVIRSRKVAEHLAGRDEMYRPHVSSGRRGLGVRLRPRRGSQRRQQL
jgi:hypothetical protein